MIESQFAKWVECTLFNTRETTTKAAAEVKFTTLEQNCGASQMTTKTLVSLRVKHPKPGDQIIFVGIQPFYWESQILSRQNNYLSPALEPAGVLPNDFLNVTV